MVDGGNDIKPTATPTFLGGGAAVDITDTVKSHTASIPTPEIEEPVSVAPPPIPPVANPSAANEFTGETALELCIAKGDEVGVRILKAAGAKDPDA